MTDITARQQRIVDFIADTVRERIEHIGSTLDRVERFDQKLRAITLLSDPQRNLAMGPTETEPGVVTPPATGRPTAVDRHSRSTPPT